MKIELVKIDDLIPNENNPRIIKKDDLKKLIVSIKEFGFQEPVIVNNHIERKNIIIGGHQRVKAAKNLGYKAVPVVYIELTKEKEYAFNIALNKISGDWDEIKLSEMLKHLNDSEIDVNITGFNEPEIDKILINAEKQMLREEMLDKAPPPPKKAKTKQGDIWKLGDHTLMCGDSTKPEDFNILMGKTKADLCWTDPPYGVSYKGANHDEIKNDDLREKELFNFLKVVYVNIYNHTKKTASMYSCYASKNHIIFENALNHANFEVKQQLIWEKGHVLSRSDYHWSHEPILYCKKENSTTEWYGDRTHKTVILENTIENLYELKKEQLIDIINKIREDSDLVKEQKDPTSQYVHATQKPVNLSERLIKNSTKVGQIVLEPFCGSGSTLMACECSKRVCMAIELDPVYCDVILKRWSDYTGKDPIRSDGRRWSDLNLG